MSIINLNLTEFMCSEDRLPLVRAYAEMADAAIQAGKIEGWLTTKCPECDSDFADIDEAHQDTDHIIITTVSDSTAVLVGCEGYFTVDPNKVGIESRNWQNWFDNETGGTLPQGVS